MIVQANAINRSRMATVLCVVLTTNLRLMESPGNVLVSARSSGLPKDSVANVSQMVTLDRAFLEEQIGRLPPRLMNAVDTGLKLVLGLT